MSLKKSEFVLILSVLCAASMWFYVEQILVPYQQAYALKHSVPRGNLSDLYPRWLGARELLLHNRDPYSPEITREIQAGYYGRPLDPGRATDPKDQQRFAYPVYVIFLLAPLVKLPFSIVHAGFRWFLLGLTVLTAFLWLRILGWKLSRLGVVASMLFVVGSFPVAQGILLQQISLIVSFLIAVVFFLLTQKRYGLAGVFLALATIKPHLAILVVAWLLLWSFSEWRERKNVFWGFSVTLALLCGAGEWVLPGWGGKFVKALAAYGKYTDNRSVANLILGPFWGSILAFLILFALGMCCWRARKGSQDNPNFIFVAAVALTSTLVVLPSVSPYNQILLLPAVFFLIKNFHSLWRRKLISQFVLVGAILTVVWPWIATIFLSTSFLLTRAEWIFSLWGLPLHPSVITALAAFICLGLYLPVFNSIKARPFSEAN